MFESHWHGGILYREEVLPDFIKEGTKMMKKSKRKVLELFESGYPDSLEPGTYSALAEIHRYLFEDIYPFAGKLREENISKGEFRFAQWEYVEQELNRLLEQLKQENFLEGLEKNQLAKKLAYYLSEMNVLHPFREGNR